MKRIALSYLLSLGFVFVQAQTVNNDFVKPSHFHNRSAVSYTLTQADTVTLQVYNRWGQVVLPVITKTKRPAGAYRDSLQMQGIPDEFYALVLKIGKETYVKNIIKDEKNVVTPLTFHGDIYDHMVDSLYKIYPRPTTQALDLKTVEREFVRPDTYKSQTKFIRIQNPVGQIYGMEQEKLGNLSIDLFTKAEKKADVLGLADCLSEGNTIHGKMRNSSLIAWFNDVLVTVNFYTAADTLLAVKHYLIEGPFKPGATDFQLMLDPPNASQKFSIEISGETVDNWRRSVVRKKYVNEVNLFSDLIPGYPSKAYNNTIDYVEISIFTTCEGKNIKAVSTGQALSAEQKTSLANMDVNSPLKVEIKFKYKDPFFDDLGSNEKIKKMHYTVQVIN